jgi:DNA-directed RNA polymerase subunit RPC12/RpoP
MFHPSVIFTFIHIGSYINSEEDVMRCWSCKEKLEVEDIEDDEPILCSTCGEKNFVIGTRTMDYDEYYEAMCDSEASKRTEEAFHGHDNEDDFESDTHSFRDRED